MTDFESTTEIKSLRKSRPCFGCGRSIHQGRPAVRRTGSFRGGFCSSAWHTECDAVALQWMSNGWRPAFRYWSGHARSGWDGLFKAVIIGAGLSRDEVESEMAAFPHVVERLYPASAQAGPCV